MIPADNFLDTAFCWHFTEVSGFVCRTSGCEQVSGKQWMLERIAIDPKIPVSDCSGMPVGLLRKHKLVEAKFDTTANGLCGSTYSKSVKKSELMPGDWVGKSGHIGIYVGGGLVVEFYGGAYGCQLTELDNRRGYDFLDKRFEKGSAWTKYRRPKYY